ncbi:MAG: hypothetical protein BWY86_01182 [Candidatus Aminicenantes bacterium ADurb.Bin508]|nr:MAG: hypothetical protein BWY86_01182 [Candidatus Aminicenantes bacterium ADurb.Bin508]
MRLMSLTPEKAMFRVRGMGVALMVRTSIFSFHLRIFSFCFTPKRCSSSMTRRPRFLKRTLSERREWVPIRMSRVPLRSLSRMSVFSWGVVVRLKEAILMGKVEKRREKVCMCW